VKIKQIFKQNTKIKEAKKYPDEDRHSAELASEEKGH
jgi:hypothetical protein